MGRRRETWKHEEIDRGREEIHGSKERAQEEREQERKTDVTKPSGRR